MSKLTCQNCTHHSIHREEWMDDCYTIFCKHPEQINTEGFNHKIKFGDGRYFNCPLDTHDVVICEICGWEDDEIDLLEYCPRCNAEL